MEHSIEYPTSAWNSPRPIGFSVRLPVRKIYLQGIPGSELPNKTTERKSNALKDAKERKSKKISRRD